MEGVFDMQNIDVQDIDTQDVNTSDRNTLHYKSQISDATAFNMPIFTTRTIVCLGLLIAMHIVLSRFLSINAWNIKIGFSFVPIFIAAWLYGALGAILVGGLGDFLGAIMFPIGPYFPGFTLSCALSGLVFGLLLHQRRNPSRIVLAVCINQFGISLFLTTLWISILYGTPYMVLLGMRLVQAIILTIVEISTISLLSQGSLVMRYRLASKV